MKQKKKIRDTNKDAGRNQNDRGGGIKIAKGQTREATATETTTNKNSSAGLEKKSQRKKDY